MLRTILLIIGVLIIFAIAWDGWRRKRRQQQVAKSKTIEPKLNFSEKPEVCPDTDKNLSVELPDDYIEYSEQVESQDSDNVISTSFVEKTEHDGHLELEEVDSKASANQAIPEKHSALKPEQIFSANEVLPKIKPLENREDKATSETEQVSTKPNKEIVSLTVMPVNSRPFAGYDLIKTLEENNLHYGEFSIYHRHKYKNGKGPLYFSVASLVNPGSINPKQLGTLSTPGLTVFMELNNPKHDRIVFKQMLATSHQLAKDLQGIVCDDKRVPLREASIKSYANKINL